MTSLKDQLLKAGLVDAKQAKQASREKRKQDKQTPKGQSQEDEAKRAAELARVAKAERDRELNRQKQQQVEQKALQAQIRQLIENHRQPRGQGREDTEYRFTDGTRIKTLRVSPEVHRRIAAGSMAIVRLGEGYELVPRIVADKIAQRDPGAVLVSHARPTTAEAQDAEEDDPYKDYVIPDDLMW